MRANCIILIILFISLQVKLEANNTVSYYINIYKAELCLMDSNFGKALQYYEEAFKNIDIPWATDYHNACLASVFSGEHDKTFDYLDKLLEKGIHEEYQNKMWPAQQESTKIYRHSSPGVPARFPKSQNKQITNRLLRKTPSITPYRVFRTG